MQAKNKADKVFRVDKSIVFKSTLPWAVVLSILLLLLMHNLDIKSTLADKKFWVAIVILWACKFLIDIWTILYERIEFRGNEITSYYNRAETANVLEFASVKQKKNAYVNALGFEYKEPKGVILRYLFNYKNYNYKDRQAIMQEIMRINPNIKLEDDIAKQILAGSYKNKILG